MQPETLKNSQHVVRTLKFIAISAVLYFTACNHPAAVTVVLGAALNANITCIGHAQGLCGTEKDLLPTEIAGVFASEPDCEGIRLRRLADKETVAGLPRLLNVYYMGSRKDRYMGTGKDENEGWMFTFNGPNGHFAAHSRTELEMIKRVCTAAKGLGANIDNSVGYTQLPPAANPQ
jgi:hypothetical protein